MADTQSLSLFLQTPSVSIWQHCLSTILWLHSQQSLLYLQVGACFNNAATIASDFQIHIVCHVHRLGAVDVGSVVTFKTLLSSMGRFWHLVA